MSFVRLPSPTINVKRVQDGDGFLTRDTNKNPILARIVLNAKQYARLEPTLLAGFAAASDRLGGHGVSMSVQGGSSSEWHVIQLVVSFAFFRVLFFQRFTSFESNLAQ
jgi:hypothetical protein